MGAALSGRPAAVKDLTGLAALALLLLAVTWGRWPDLLSDFGRELYIPWQISQGQVLYRDLFYLNGPLSPYYHALLFRVFGASLLVLVLSNLAVLALATVLIYQIIRDMSDRRTAQAAVLVFLLLFAFGHLENSGNYNFITPYSHEMTHGLLLALALLALLARDPEGRRARGLALAGLLYGLIFLTKVEIFVAATAMVLAWLSWLRRERRLQAISMVLMAAIIPVVVFGLILVMQMDWRTALAGLGGGWSHLLRAPLIGQFFYRKLSGLDNPGLYGRLFLAGIASVLLLIAAAGCYDYCRHRRRTRWLEAGIGLCLLGALWLKAPFPPVLAGPELPLVALAGITWAIKNTTREKIHQTGPRPLPTDHYLLLWSVLAAALLLRLGLRPRLPHYGFVLALPAALLLVVLALHHIPRLLAAWYGGGQSFRRLALGGLAVSVGFWLALSGICYATKTVWVGHGADAIRTYSARREPLSAGLAEAVAYIEEHTPPASTLAALPEGALINYLTRRLNPTPYLSYMPAEMAVAGEEAMLAALEQARPDYVLVVRRGMQEYGYLPYGAGDFSPQILSWLDREYEIREQFDSPVSLFQKRNKKEVAWKRS